MNNIYLLSYRSIASIDSTIGRKANKLAKLITSMISIRFRDRPDCSSILNSINDWVFDTNELTRLHKNWELPQTLQNPENKFYSNFLNTKLHNYSTKSGKIVRKFPFFWSKSKDN